MKQYQKNRLVILKALSDPTNWKPNCQEIAIKLNHSPDTIKRYYDKMKKSLFVKVILKNEIDPEGRPKESPISNDLINKTTDTKTFRILTELRKKVYWSPCFTKINEQTGIGISTIFGIFERNAYRFKLVIRFKIVICPLCGKVGGESDYLVATKSYKIGKIPVLDFGYGCPKCKKAFGFEEKE